MAEVEVVPAKSAHVWYVALMMRHADQEELRASGSDPMNALVSGLRTSTRAWTAIVDGDPCLMFGVAPASVLGGVGTPWLLGTDDIYRIK